MNQSVAAAACSKEGIALDAFIDSCLIDMEFQRDEALIAGSIEAMKEQVR